MQVKKAELLVSCVNRIDAQQFVEHLCEDLASKHGSAKEAAGFYGSLGRAATKTNKLSRPAFRLAQTPQATNPFLRHMLPAGIIGGAGLAGGTMLSKLLQNQVTKGLQPGTPGTTPTIFNFGQPQKKGSVKEAAGIMGAIGGGAGKVMPNVAGGLAAGSLTGLGAYAGTRGSAGTMANAMGDKLVRAAQPMFDAGASTLNRAGAAIDKATPAIDAVANVANKANAGIDKVTGAVSGMGDAAGPWANPFGYMSQMMGGGPGMMDSLSKMPPQLQYALLMGGMGLMGGGAGYGMSGTGAGTGMGAGLGAMSVPMMMMALPYMMQYMQQGKQPATSPATPAATAPAPAPGAAPVQPNMPPAAAPPPG
jgi:hypothetical protein